MTTMVMGVYKEGRIELLEKPEGLREGRVRIILTEDEEAKPTPRYLQFGKYKGDTDPSLEDFKAAEWNGEAEFDDL